MLDKQCLDKAIAFVRDIADGFLQRRKRLKFVDGGSRATEDLRKEPCTQINSQFDLLRLPDTALMKMVGFLSPEEQLKLFQTSRACAYVVMNYHGDRKSVPTCTVFKSTTWRGLRQVLSWIPTPMFLRFNHTCMDCNGISAYDVFLGSATIPATTQQAICNNWKFPCIQNISVMECKLRSLIPRVLAATCPNIQWCRTSVRVFTNNLPHNTEELHPCPKLRQLVFCDKQAHVRAFSALLPMPHHSAAELVAAFPNLESLQFKGAVTPFVLQTFSQHALNLIVKPTTVAEAALVQSYTKVRILKLVGNLAVNDLLPLPTVTEHLKTLRLHGAIITDSIFEQLLQLPNLEVLQLSDLNNLRQDYSKRAFQKQVSLEMNGQVQELSIFAKLPLNSFAHCSLSNEKLEIHLPDPSHSDSIATVQQVAKHVADTALEFRVSHKMKWVLPATANDADAALLFSVAAPILSNPGSVIEYDLGAIIGPAYLAATIEWAAETTEGIHMLLTPEASKPYVWQMLQRMPHLAYVGLAAEPHVQQQALREELVAQACDVICSAAKHLVEPVFKSGECLTFYINVGTPNYKDDALCKKHVDLTVEVMHETLPNTVHAYCCEVYEKEWKLSLAKLDRSPDVGSDPGAAII